MNNSSTINRLRETVTTKYQHVKKKIPKDRLMLKQFFKELWTTGKKPLLIAGLAAIALLILIPLLTYLFFIRDLTTKDRILAKKSEGVVLLDRNDKPFFTFYQARTQQTIPLSEIPEHMQHAVVAIEDRDFYEHSGFSLEGIGRALLTNIREEEIAQGGSTITQQLVKNTLLTPDRNLLRKYQELILALEIERRYSKEEILEMYLNTVYFGEGAYGVQNAAKAYFSKNASELTLPESALLAGILPAPSAYSPLSGSESAALRRQALVLQQMQEQGYITEEEYQKAENAELTYNPTPQEINEQAPHFALMVIDELSEEYGEQRVARSGFTVKTTLDLDKQEYAEQAVANQVQRLGGNSVTNGAAVAMDPETGEIIALVGSHNWFDEENGKVNMAVRPRQPGSSFKPIVYARGIEERTLTAATMLKDERITFPDGYTPRNYDNRFRGEVRVRYALANSLNIPALHAIDQVGIPDTIEQAEKMGITTLDEPSRYGLSLVLGAAEVPLIEMTGAFATLANEGDYVQPTTILEIRDKEGTLIYTHTPHVKEALSEGAAFIISSILSDNRARADTFGGALTISRPAAVKTGTTDDYIDALTIGYTPSLVVGAWVGNNDREPMDSVAGSLGAAPIWRQIMEYFLRGTPVEQFRVPPSVIRQKVCTTTINSDESIDENDTDENIASQSAYTEYFLPGTAPSQPCEVPTPTPSVTETPTPTPTDEPDNTPTPTPSPTRNPSPTPTPTTIPATPTPTPTPTDQPFERPGIGDGLEPDN